MSIATETAAVHGISLHADALLPIAVAAERLARSVETLKRAYKKGHLPAVIDGQWAIPESFVQMVIRSPRPAQAGSLKQAADRWFAMHAGETPHALPEAVA